jgi:uncharacterized membrane protein YfcA
VLIVVLLTTYAQTVVGFGFALLAVPVLVLRLDVQQAVVLSAILGTVSSGIRAHHLRVDRDLRLVRLYVSSAIVGAPFGLLLFLYADLRVLKVLIGLSVFAGIMVVLRGHELSSVGTGLERIMGFASGVLLTSTSTNGPPLVLGLQSRRVPPDVFRATIAAIFFVLGVASVAVFGLVGRVSIPVLLYVSVSLPAVVLANRLGLASARRIQPVMFQRLVVSLLVLSGASSIVSAFTA